MIGTPSGLGEPVAIEHALDHVFGLVLVNDWSARDIQAWEYQPLGPFLGKSFATSISRWVVPLSELADRRVAVGAQDPEPLPYLREAPWAFDIDLEVELNGTVVARTNTRHLYWSIAQQIAHLTVNGASMRTGDLLASGTISGPERGSRGSLIELSWNGEEPIELPDGSSRSFLEDGDEVVLRGEPLGEVRGRIEAAAEGASGGQRPARGRPAGQAPERGAVTRSGTLPPPVGEPLCAVKSSTSASRPRLLAASQGRQGPSALVTPLRAPVEYHPRSCGRGLTAERAGRARPSGQGPTPGRSGAARSRRPSLTFTRSLPRPANTASRPRPAASRSPPRPPNMRSAPRSPNSAVAAEPADHRVVVRAAAREDVVPAAAHQAVVPGVAAQLVPSALSGQLVRSGVADQCVPAVASLDGLDGDEAVGVRRRLGAAAIQRDEDPRRTRLGSSPRLGHGGRPACRLRARRAGNRCRARP